MPISAIDTVTLAPRSAEASNLVGKEQHQTQHIAESGAANFSKNVEAKRNKTEETNKAEKEEYRFDGSGGNEYQSGKRKKKKKDNQEAPMAPRSNSSFDIMI